MPETIDTALGPVEAARRGSGPPVLFVHGSPGGFDSSLQLVLAHGTHLALWAHRDAQSAQERAVAHLWAG